MKNCPFCAEEIQDAAVVCRFCQRSLTPVDSPAVLAASPQKENQSRTLLWFIGLSAALVWIIAMLAMVGRESQAQQGPPSPQATTGHVLELKSALMRQSSSNYMTVEGEVVNLTEQSLERIAVVITWRDRVGGFITSNTVLIDYDPILPKQTSPFKVISKRNPQMDHFDISFRQLGGPMLPMKDSRGYR
jgi:hypothetical protein